MEQPLDDIIIEISKLQYVNYLRVSYLLFFSIGIIGFLFYCFVAIKLWFSYVRGAWKNKRDWSSDLRFSPKFFKYMLKGSPVWMLGGWPLLLLLTELASAEALNILFSYEVFYYPELTDK